MIYEIINLSDPYTIEAADFKTACVATAILGEGAYGLAGEEDMPILLFGVADTWFPERFGKTFEEVLRGIPPAALADCLASVLCRAPIEYEREWKTLALIRAIQGEEAYQALRLRKHDQRRSSMNDIGRRAWALAERIRGK